MLRILTTLAIYVGIGPLIGTALALNWILPGGQSSPRELFDIALLGYMVGGPFAFLTGAAALYLKRFTPVVYCICVLLFAGVIGFLGGGWLIAGCSLVACLACTVLDVWLNPAVRPLPPAHE